MALNLLRSGHSVSIYVHRNRDALVPLFEMGARETAKLSELARTSSIVLLCVNNAETVCSVVEGIAPTLRNGQLVLDATTSDPDVSRRVAESLLQLGVAYADVPVTGGPAEATAGQLATLVGCEECDFARVQGIAARYSKVVQRIGGVGAGHLAKLLNNFVTQGTVVLLAEAYGRAREFGADWSSLYAVMSAGAARSGTLEKMVLPALDGDFDGSRFTIQNALKDLTYFCELTQRSTTGPSAIGEGIRATFARAVAAGFGDRYVGGLLDPSLRDSAAISSTSAE